MRQRPRVLFLSHAASRNGASLVLLHTLQWLKPRVDWEIEILVEGTGPLLDDFRDVGRTSVVRDVGRALGFSGRTGQMVRSSVRAWSARAMLANRRFDVVYANTAAVWPWVEALTSRTAAVLWHIHELNYALSLELHTPEAASALRRATRVIAVSRAVRDALIQHWGVSADRIDLIHEFVPTWNIGAKNKAERGLRVRERLGFPPDAFVVGGCGGMGWRKGTDLFRQIARRVIEERPDARFMWVGGGLHATEKLQFDYDVRACGLEGRCIHVPASADVLDFYCAMDVFALTSREDPFPLVMLEAGALAVPTVCFEGAGGGPEFVESHPSLVAAHQDVEEFAARLLRLCHDRQLLQRLGEHARATVLAGHTAESQGPKTLASIERTLAGVHGRDA